jgi:hypothetical protein
MHTLWRLYEKNEAYQAVLHIDDLAPSDKMELGPVKNLFKVLSLLEKETEADCVALHTFIKQMKSFHDLFELPQIAFADQIRMLAEVEEYFSSWSREPGWKESCITAELELQISTTLKSLQRIETSFGTTLPSLIWGQMLLRTILVLCGQKSDIPIFLNMPIRVFVHGLN